MKKMWDKIMNISLKLIEDRVSAYAAQSAFFTMLSLIPMILLLMTLVRYTPVTQNDIIKIAYELFPRTVSPTIVAIVNEVYNQSLVTIPITLIVAIWSAGKGVMAIANGLNSLHGIFETRNYVFVRVRAAFYTVAFIVAVILTLVLMGFGNSISLLVNKYIPVLRYVTDFVIEIRTVVTIAFLGVLTTCMYRFLPNRKTKLKFLIPGAVFTAIGWLLASFIFSVYLDIFKGFSNMYGSLTTIVVIMLWLYFCMYILLLGGELNVLFEEWLDNHNE